MNMKNAIIIVGMLAVGGFLGYGASKAWGGAICDSLNDPKSAQCERDLGDMPHPDYARPAA